MSVQDPGDGTGGSRPPLQVSISVGVVVERRESESRWVDEVWMPVGVIPAYPAGEHWQLMREAGRVKAYLARVVSLSLHRAEVEAYKLNLSEPMPKVFIVMMPHGEGDFPYEVELATCAPYEAESYLMEGEEIVEPVPMPPELIAWVKDFIDGHYQPDGFVKRQRDTAPALVQHQFGKDPIFGKAGRYASGRGDGDDG